MNKIEFEIVMPVGRYAISLLRENFFKSAPTLQSIKGLELSDDSVSLLVRGLGIGRVEGFSHDPKGRAGSDLAQSLSLQPKIGPGNILGRTRSEGNDSIRFIDDKFHSIGSCSELASLRVHQKMPTGVVVRWHNRVQWFAFNGTLQSSHGLVGTGSKRPRRSI